MPTQLRSDTARANGAKSHSPATAEGRENSSRNAVKHGLFSRNPLVLECENDDDFEVLHNSQMEIHQPATPAEKDLVDQMVAARWRVLASSPSNAASSTGRCARRKSMNWNSPVAAALRFRMPTRDRPTATLRWVLPPAANPASTASTSAPTKFSASGRRPG